MAYDQCDQLRIKNEKSKEMNKFLISFQRPFIDLASCNFASNSRHPLSFFNPGSWLFIRQPRLCLPRSVVREQCLSQPEQCQHFYLENLYQDILVCKRFAGPCLHDSHSTYPESRNHSNLILFASGAIHRALRLHCLNLTANLKENIVSKPEDQLAPHGLPDLVGISYGLGDRQLVMIGDCDCEHHFIMKQVHRSTLQPPCA